MGKHTGQDAEDLPRVQKLRTPNRTEGEEMIDLNDLLTPADKKKVCASISGHIVKCVKTAIDNNAAHFEEEIKAALTTTAKRISDALVEDAEILFARAKVRDILTKITEDFE